jgi:peptidoglycan hydrolase-like protein with peptidoglycan-binding domain
VLAASFVVASCSNDSSNKSAAPTTSVSAIDAAQARVETAQSGLTTANDSFSAASKQFCTDAKDYVSAVDRYGKLFTDSKATVGDVKTAGSDLATPRASVSSAATAVSSAKTDVANAEKELTEAQDALAAAKASASSVPAPPTSPAPTTTTLVAPATISNVERAEDDLATASSAITDATPLTEATATYNAAALELEVAWLQLLAEAGCFTDEQQARAAEQVSTYMASLQADLQTAGYYKGPIDGIYGPQTVAAVEQLQTDSGLPVTGLVDQATAVALDKKVAAVGQQAAAQQQNQTAALQTVLTLTGYWTGPIDGIWTPELTAALTRFQTALGVPPTGVVDAATMAAFQQALATVKAAANAPPTTTTPAPTTTATTATPPGSPVPVPTTLAPSTTTTETTGST